MLKVAGSCSNKNFCVEYVAAEYDTNNYGSIFII